MLKTFRKTRLSSFDVLDKNDSPPPRGPELSSLQHQTETEEPYFIYSKGDPFVFKVPSGRLLDHFMPWVHPFTSVVRILGEQIGHSLVHVVHLVVYDDQVFFSAGSRVLKSGSLVLFKNPRDMSQIMALAHQMYPRRTHLFLESFARATAKPHGYLKMLSANSHRQSTRLRSALVMRCLRIHDLAFVSILYHRRALLSQKEESDLTERLIFGISTSTDCLCSSTVNLYSVSM
jgi:hypothetical protein